MEVHLAMTKPELLSLLDERLNNEGLFEVSIASNSQVALIEDEYDIDESEDNNTEDV